MFCLFVISSTVRNVDACRPAPHHRCLAGEYRISIENDPLRPLPAGTARPPLSSPPPSHCKAFLLPLPERSVLVYILLARRSPDRMTPPPPQLCAFVIVTSLTHCKGDRWRRSRSGWIMYVQTHRTMFTPPFFPTCTAAAVVREVPVLRPTDPRSRAPAELRSESVRPKRATDERMQSKSSTSFSPHRSPSPEQKQEMRPPSDRGGRGGPGGPGGAGERIGF